VLFCLSLPVLCPRYRRAGDSQSLMSSPAGSSRTTRRREGEQEDEPIAGINEKKRLEGGGRDAVR
jgi:hypothetical protein